MMPTMTESNMYKLLLSRGNVGQVTNEPAKDDGLQYVEALFSLRSVLRFPLSRQVRLRCRRK